MAGCGVAGDEDRRSREIRRHSLEVLIKKVCEITKVLEDRADNCGEEECWTPQRHEFNRAGSH